MYIIGEEEIEAIAGVIRSEELFRYNLTLNQRVRATHAPPSRSVMPRI